jgi:hypothetical protein
MLNRYRTISDALAEIQHEYEREILRWHRIRRQALERGLDDLASCILTEICKAQWDINDNRFTYWKYYTFLFQLDNPDHDPITRDLLHSRFGV